MSEKDFSIDTSGRDSARASLERIQQNAHNGNGGIDGRNVTIIQAPQDNSWNWGTWTGVTLSGLALTVTAGTLGVAGYNHYQHNQLAGRVAVTETAVAMLQGQVTGLTGTINNFVLSALEEFTPRQLIRTALGNIENNAITTFIRSFCTSNNINVEQTVGTLRQAITNAPQVVAALPAGGAGVP